jgi:hypothetical protein
VKLRIPVVAFCLCYILMLCVTPFCLAVDENQARSAIVQADQTIKDCYLAVAAAEKAGGNVTDLLSTLQYVGMLLSKANLAFGRGDFDSAYNLAVQSKAKLDGVVADADSMKNAAEQRGITDFMINVVGSSVGTVAVLFGSLAVWFGLKRRYGKMGDVNSNES